MKKAWLILLLAACAGAPAPLPASLPSGPAPAVPFSQFVDDYFTAFFDFWPPSATHAGFHDYDQRMVDFSRARIERRIAELHGLAGRLAAYRGHLGADEAIDAQALAGKLDGEILDFETIQYWKKNPFIYVLLPGRALDELVKRSFAPPAERLRSVIARLRAVPAMYAAAKANLDNPPRELTEISMRMARGSVGFFAKTLPEWARDAAGGDTALLAEFNAANAAALAGARDFAEWLEKDLLPRSHGSYALGAEVFAAKIKDDEMIDTPLPELLATGEEQLERDYAAFVDVARQIDPSRTPAQVYARISDEHFSEADLIPGTARALEDIRKFIVAKGIITIPSEVRPRVEETPGYSRLGGFASMDTPGAYETKATEAFYYVTPPEKDWDAKHKDEHLRRFSPASIAVISTHEVYPGHYVQFLYSPRWTTKTRKLIGVSSNSEGWAHYAEQMMVEQGFGAGDPKIALAQRAEALVRDCRYLSAINLHTSAWTLERATKCFTDKAFLSPANAFEEARRGTFNPTYLSYTAGKLAIIKLRDEYMHKTGASLKQFHDAFVSAGALPIPLVRQILLR